MRETDWADMSTLGRRNNMEQNIQRGFHSHEGGRNVTIGAAFLLASWASDIGGRGYKKEQGGRSI